MVVIITAAREDKKKGKFVQTRLIGDSRIWWTFVSVVMRVHAPCARLTMDRTVLRHDPYRPSG